MNILNELEKYLLAEINISQEIEKQSISPDEDILSQGIIDSLGFLKLTAFIEERFGVKVADEDMELENFMNLESIKAFIESKQSR
jgi:acyl carrier protein